MSELLKVDSVSKIFSGHQILDSVSFTINEGQIVGLLGPNGAGKSTLMNIICGLYNPDSGSAKIAGKKYQELNSPVLQVSSMLSPEWIDPRHTCITTLKTHALRINRPDSEQEIIEILEKVQLRGNEKKRVGDFSLGMRQRLALALALMSDPQLLILDEPVNGLDADGIQWIRTLLRDFADKGGSVLLSSHLMSEVQLVASHIVIIKNGKVVLNNSVDEIYSKESRVELGVNHLNQSDLLEMLQNTFEAVWDSQKELFYVYKTSTEDVYNWCVNNNITVTHLSNFSSSLEDIYFESLEEKKASQRV